jgi:hypothetical protein
MSLSTAGIGYALSAVEIVERQVIVTMSGDVGVERALRGSAPGWRRHRTLIELMAHHEAAHAICAAVLGFFVYEISIVPDKSITFHEGRCFEGGHVLFGAIKGEPPVHSLTDRQVIVRLCYAVATETGWKGTLRRVRELRTRTVEIVENNWGAVSALAQDLQQRPRIEREEFAVFADNHVRAAA